MSVTTNAVSSMNSSDVGRSRPSTTDAKLPSLSTRRSLPVSGAAGLPSFSGVGGRSQTPCERAYSSRQRPSSTSTIRLAPEATSVAGDLDVKRTTLPVLRQMRDGAGLAHEDRAAVDLEARGDDVPERGQLADMAVPGDAQHTVVVTVGDQQAATELLQRVLDAAGHEEVGRGRVRDRPGTEIGDHGRAALLLDPVDAVDDVGLAERGADERDEHVRGVTDEGDVDRSADAHLGNRRGQAARVHRGGARLGIHSQDAAARAVGHVQRLVGADRAARAAAAHTAWRGEGGQLVYDRPRIGLAGVRRGRHGHGHRRDGRHHHHQRSLGRLRAHGRASRTRLNGVSAARRKRVNPAAVTSSRKRASPACAPSASPTSWDSEAGVHSSVENP